jgi:glutamyl endopeptidase
VQKLRGLSIAAGSALFLTLVGGPAAGLASSASAADGRHAVVSSDGSVVEVASSDFQGSDSFEGTGVPIRSSTSPGGAGESDADLGIESIIGPDTRARVNPTTTFPARAVAKITYAGGNCTGWMIGPNTVATTGHCVHEGSGGNFRPVGSFTVTPGRNGSQTPFGSCGARTLFTVNGWAASGDERYDYGAIKLNCNVGNNTGWFGFFWQSASLTGQAARINGYPLDKPFGEQWRSDDQIRVSQTRQVFYANDTFAGMPGGPVYRNRPAGSPFCVGYCAMAIHDNGLHGSFPHNTYNHGPRIVEAVFDNLIAWRNA